MRHSRSCSLTQDPTPFPLSLSHWAPGKSLDSLSIQVLAGSSPHVVSTEMTQGWPKPGCWQSNPAAVHTAPRSWPCPARPPRATSWVAPGLWARHASLSLGLTFRPGDGPAECLPLNQSQQAAVPVRVHCGLGPHRGAPILGEVAN